MERIKLSYANAADLLHDLRRWGRNLHLQRFANLRGRNWRRSLEAALTDLVKPDRQGRLEITIEVIYGHAVKPLPKVRMQEQSSVTLEQMKTLLNQTSKNTRLE
jgi:malonyl-CoA O-methyltransferase